MVFASLQDAGFHPETECDLRGWMHFYRWPQGSQRPVTIWVPESEHTDALDFLAAPFEVAPPSLDEADEGFWADIRDHQRGYYVGWLALVIFGAY